MSIRSYKALLWVAVVGAALAMLIFPLSLFAHEVTTDPDHIHYNEKGTKEVQTFESDDPEGAGILWTVRGVDAADFAISSGGVLTFKKSPDFENPTDRARAELDLNGDNDQDDPGESAVLGGNNSYQITVSATEVWNGSDESLPAKRSDLDVTVFVNDVDDHGELTLEWLQPEVGVAIDAMLTDEDGATTLSGAVGTGDDAVTLGYTWYTSKVADPVVGTSFHWNRVTDNNLITNGGVTYTPAAADADKYLWVRATYTDTQDADDTAKTADVKSANPVRTAPAIGDNGSPDFGTRKEDTRTVSESLAVDAEVGDPVEAVDPDPEDIVTYELDDDFDSTSDPAATSDVHFFNIDPETGQLTVARKLDADSAGDRTGATAGEYEVIVRGTDPSGVADNITITVTAENANEAPSIAGRAVLTVMEAGGYAEFPAVDADTSPSRYVATQPETVDSIATWDLAGADASAFDLGGLFEPRYLNFKEEPNYENPTDANRDNVYEVTILATDTDPLGTGAGVGSIDVRVVVGNVEEAGKVVFTEGGTGYLNEEVIAEVQDPDDHGGDLGEPYQGVHIVSWQWSRSQTETGEFVNIDDETTNRYTPDEDDRGYYLRMTATYTDPFSQDDVVDDEAVDERVSTTEPDVNNPSLMTVMVTTENAVRLAPGPASAPMFPEAGDSGTITRRVAENTGPGGNVGDKVEATAPGPVTYSAAGSDSQYFNIDSASGQITVGGDIESTDTVTEEGTDPKLDYDDPAKRKTFSVTVKATATDKQTAQVVVNIVVTNVNEPPEVKDTEDTDENLLPRTNEDTGAELAEVKSYAEVNKDGAPNTNAVATYSARDPEGLDVNWDLRGADASFFDIITTPGVLRFTSPPDYENPRDRAGENTATAAAPADTTAGNNVYSVLVRAITNRAAGDTGPAQVVSFIVNVTVTDEDEDGMITLTQLQPEVATDVTASVTDPDGGVTGENWTWEVSEVEQPALDVTEDDHWGAATGTTSGAGDETYNPAAVDEGKFLRITVGYTDTNDANKEVQIRSAYAVQAEGDGAENQSPDFVDGSVERSVPENAAVGSNVGSQVAVRTGGNTTKDKLTYGLRAVTQTDIDGIPSAGVTLPAGANGPAADAAAFKINQATGQLTVAQSLDFESRGPADNRNGEYVVVVTVIDPSGLDHHVVVVITASDVNDNPVLGVGVNGRPELTIQENRDGNTSGDQESPAFTSVEAFDGNTAGNLPTVNYYTVTDQDRHASISRWTLTGADAGDLQLIGTVGRTLVFRDAPDFENPADADGDNVYKVTVVAIDNQGGRGEFDVCIIVTNVNESGKVTLLDANGRRGDAAPRPSQDNR